MHNKFEYYSHNPKLRNLTAPVQFAPLKGSSRDFANQDEPRPVGWTLSPRANPVYAGRL
jgi:hypothetical protein